LLTENLVVVGSLGQGEIYHSDKEPDVCVLMLMTKKEVSSVSCFS
jgi:hypothetical protein